jgi:hypothetical protein
MGAVDEKTDGICVINSGGIILAGKQAPPESHATSGPRLGPPGACQGQGLPL